MQGRIPVSLVYLITLSFREISLLFILFLPFFLRGGGVIDNILTKIICSEAGSNGGYWIATDYKEVRKTLDHLYKRSMEMLKNYSILKRKAKLDKQKRIRLSKYEKDMIESIMEKSDE